MSEYVQIKVEGGVLTITLNRPDKKNALTRAMYASMGGAIEQADADPAVRCVLIEAEGDMFTAGNDIGEFAATGAAPAAADKASPGEGPNAERRVSNPLLHALANAKTPIIAAVQGRAVGIGVTMLLHCDLVYVAEDALLSTPFVNLALVPEAASSLLMPLRIGYARAFAMFALGEPIDGRTAAQIGLANAALPAAEVRIKARTAAAALAQRSPSAVAITKGLMRDAEKIVSVMLEEGGHFASQLRSPEAKEAFAAFAERRAPDFSKFS